MGRQRQSYLPLGMAASVERRQVLCHPLSCRLAYILNILRVSMVRSAGLEIRGRTVRCFCRYLFSIHTTTMKAILQLLTRPSLTRLLLLIRRRHSRLRMTEVTTNCVPPTCKALAMP
jgi:hypothetical protein